MAQTGWYPLHITSPIGQTFNYADGGSGKIYAPQLFWLARRFQQPVWAGYQARTPRPQALDVLWYSPDQADPRAGVRWKNTSRERSGHVPGSWEQPRAMFIGFTAGKNNDSHGQLDVGSFVLDALGERWAMDFGSDNYNLPGYLGKQRWEYYRLRAEGQNTLVVNPGAGPDQHLAATPITRFVSQPQRAFAIGELKGPSRGRAAGGTRSGAVDRERVLFQDELDTVAPAEVWWFMHTQARVRLEAEGAVAILERGGQQLAARILAPAHARFTVRRAEPPPTSPHPPEQGNNDSVRKLTIHLENVKDLRLAVLFTARQQGGSRGGE